jgi:hypothetical protein
MACSTWFPSKVIMPLASSVNLVIADANDIIHTLQNPTANSPLAPLANSEVASTGSPTFSANTTYPQSPPPLHQL